MLDVVAQLVAQDIDDGRKSTPLVVALQVLDVLQHEGSRPVMGNNLGGIEEQRALGVAQEAVRSAQGIFLGHAGYRERLAGKPRQKHVERLDKGRVFRELPDIPANRVIVPEIERVGLLRVRVPLRGEAAPAADALESETKTSDAGKQVDECEAAAGLGCFQPATGGVLEGANGEPVRLALSLFVAVNGSECDSEKAGSILKGQASLLPQPGELILFATHPHTPNHFLCRFLSPWHSMPQRAMYYVHYLFCCCTKSPHCVANACASGTGS